MRQPVEAVIDRKRGMRRKVLLMMLLLMLLVVMSDVVMLLVRELLLWLLLMEVRLRRGHQQTACVERLLLCEGPAAHHARGRGTVCAVQVPCCVSERQTQRGQHQRRRVKNIFKVSTRHVQRHGTVLS
jgi:hypothetical protein